MIPPYRADFTRTLPHELQTCIIDHVAEGPQHLASLRAANRHLRDFTAPHFDRMVQLGDAWHGSAVVSGSISFAPQDREAGFYSVAPPIPAGLDAEHVHLFFVQAAERQLKELHVAKKRAFAPRFHPGRDDLVLQMQQRDVRVFKRQGDVLETLVVHSLAPWSPHQDEKGDGCRAAWHPEGEHYVYVDYEGQELVLRRFRLDGEVLPPWRLPRTQENEINHVAFSPSGLLAVAGRDALFILDVEGRRLHTRPYAGENGCLEWARQGSVLAYHAAACRIDFVDFSGPQPQVLGTEAISHTDSGRGLIRVGWHPSSLGYAIIDLREIRVASFDGALPEVRFYFPNIGLHPEDVREQDIVWAPCEGTMLLAVMVGKQAAIVSPWETGPKVWRSLSNLPDGTRLDWRTQQTLQLTGRGREGFEQLRIPDALSAESQSEQSGRELS
jgi:hypothetical protein